MTGGINDYGNYTNNLTNDLSVMAGPVNKRQTVFDPRKVVLN